jgi:hypothetical protein
MTTITLEQIESKQTELADLIAKFKAQSVELPTVLAFTVEISLAAGEHYAGLALRADGTPGHHLVLLPGEAEGMTWDDAKAWAASVGGELPTRQEQALLYANCAHLFKQEWYWSGVEHTSGSNAWYQTFSYGAQDYDLKFNELRARAVRRFAA